MADPKPQDEPQVKPNIKYVPLRLVKVVEWREDRRPLAGVLLVFDSIEDLETEYGKDTPYFTIVPDTNNQIEQEGRNE